MINGIPVQPGIFTFMAAITWTTGNGRGPTRCSGFVISPTAIMSAAHCLHATKRGDVLLLANYSARLGSPNRDEGQLVQLKPIIHPRFNFNSMDNDISILKPYVDGDQLPLMNYIKPIYLPYELVPVQTEVYAMGWGKTTNQDCVAAFGQASMILLYSKQIITKVLGRGRKYYVKGDLPSSNTATCQGDSGSPLVEIRGNMQIAVGILSSGPGLYGTEWYQQTTPHMQFILEHAPDAQFV